MNAAWLDHETNVSSDGRLKLERFLQATRLREGLSNLLHYEGVQHNATTCDASLFPTPCSRPYADQM